MLTDYSSIRLRYLPAGPYPIAAFKTYAGALYTVAFKNLNPTQPADWLRTISISTVGFGPKVRRISAAQKEQLMASGRACRRFLPRAARSGSFGAWLYCWLLCFSYPC